MNFAPAVDILTNAECAVIGDRAFGDDFQKSSLKDGRGRHAGLQETGVAACAKHFPGIGDMAPDPHEVLPASRLTLDDLRARELTPFQHLIRRAPPACVMVAHAVFQAIDDAAPASLSPLFLQEILRGELGFRGVAVTDDLDMGAIDDPADAALQSILAGADIALICHSEDAQERAVDAVAGAIRETEASPGAGGGVIGPDTQAERELLPPELARGDARRYRVCGAPGGEGEDPRGSGGGQGMNQ